MIRGNGGTGRRSGLKIRLVKQYEFESRFPHQKVGCIFALLKAYYASRKEDRK